MRLESLPAKQPLSSTSLDAALVEADTAPMSGIPDGANSTGIAAIRKMGNLVPTTKSRAAFSRSADDGPMIDLIATGSINDHFWLCRHRLKARH